MKFDPCCDIDTVQVHSGGFIGKNTVDSLASMARDSASL